MRISDLALGGDGPQPDDDDPTLIASEVTVTRGELRAEVADVADAIAGITPPGGRVAIAADSRVAVVALLLAVPACGRVAVPLNVRLTPEDLIEQVTRSGATVLVGSAEEVGRLAGAAERSPTLQTTVGLDHGAGDISLAALTAAPLRSTAGAATESAATDPGWVIYTSGTTGRPKGVVLTGATLAAAVATTAAARPLADDDVYLYPFPLYHVSAYNILHALHRGRPVVLPRRFDPAEVVRLTAEHAVTAMSLAPTMLRMLLDHVAAAGPAARARLRSLRTISYGAAPMPRALLAEASAVLGVGFGQGYGMTELSGNAVFLDADAHRRGLAGDERLLGAAGWPGPGVEVRVVGDDGRPVAPGVAGEVHVRGAQVCAGYWDDDEATAATIVDGWLRTGDVGRLDPDGLLTIVDRAKDIIITGGENVASREVEDAVGGHPAVAQVAVVGLPDPRWGEAVVAAVVLRPDTETAPDLLAAVEAHVAGRLARFKVPKRVVVVDELPVNAAGKVDKNALRRTLA